MEIIMHSVQPTSNNAAHIRSAETVVPTFSFWKELMALIHKQIRLRQAWQHLHAMSDHELRDIGVTRDQIDTALRRGRRAFPPPRI
jgi:uncharacterized protein YjiS (DUF1127 family)